MKGNVKNIIEFYRNADTRELTARADAVCREVHGDNVYMRGLIEFSNFCAMDCLYCGIRDGNKKVKRYRLTEDQILKTIRESAKKGLKTFVLQSGEDPSFTADRICGVVERIREEIGEEIALTLSCGIMTKKEYRALKSAGVNRYLIRFETSDPELHQKLRGGVTLKRRLEAIRDLRDEGFETGSGYMVGLPGETEEIRINNALLCHELGLDMVGIGPFIPNPDTPLGHACKHGLELTLRAVALVRLLLPEANIPATTAAGSIDEKGREAVLNAGANVLMPNITPVEYKKDYLLYPGKICLDEDGLHCIGCLNGRVGTVGKKIIMGRGDAISFTRRSGHG